MKLWVRAEASPAVGLGHVMRCVALAEVAAGAGIDVTFVLDDEAIAEAVLVRRGFPATTAHGGWTDAISPGDILVVDGYALSKDLPGEGRARGAIVVACDDLGAGLIEADVVVNPSPPPRHGYTVPDGARLLLGPHYALVREEFRQLRPDSPGAIASLLLITVGGSDPTARTAAIARGAVQAAAFERIVAVRGPLATPANRLPPEVEIAEAPDDLAGLFASAGAAIAAAGTTTWELLCLGVPTALVVVADNQRPVAAVAVTAGAALLMEDAELAARQLADGPTAAALTQAGQALVDGRGAHRVLDVVLSRADRQ